MNSPFLDSDVFNLPTPDDARFDPAVAQREDLYRATPIVAAALTRAALAFNKLQALAVRECLLHTAAARADDSDLAAQTLGRLADGFESQTRALKIELDRRAAVRTASEAQVNVLHLAAVDEQRANAELITFLERSIANADQLRRDALARFKAAGIDPESVKPDAIKPTQATVADWRAELRRRQDIATKLDAFMKSKPLLDSAILDGVELSTLPLRKAQATRERALPAADPGQMLPAFDPTIGNVARALRPAR
jgi:hypothetical protein